MKEGYVSVIVPVFNQEKYIKKCLTSIMCQSYKKLQIIIVNDGSTDSTGDILEEIKKTDERIMLYHVENGGVSQARNFAIDKADGEYIQFVDADDTISRNMTKTLVRNIRNNDADMVVCNYIKRFNKCLLPNGIIERSGEYSSDEYLINTLRDPGHHYYGVVWNKLYKAQIIKENNLSFDKNVTLGEDFIFNIQYWKNSNKVLVLRKYLYYYNKQRKATLSNVKDKSIRDCDSELCNRKKIFEVYKTAINGIVQKMNINGVILRNSNHLNTETIDIELYKYWMVFYIRQQHGVKYEYNVWNPNEREEWLSIIEADKNIIKAKAIVPEDWIKKYGSNYEFKYILKCKIKKLLNI